MPRLLKRNPAYRKHHASNQAVVWMGGRDVYLGPFGSKESRKEYDRLVALWLAGGRQMPQSEPEPLTIVELLAKFDEHAELYYRKPDGSSTSEVASFRDVMKIVNRLYGVEPACDFGPLKLEVVRQEMIKKGWCRSHINHQISRLRLIFKWGVSKELIPASAYTALAAVCGLRVGRTTAKEAPPVGPVAEEIVNATLPHLSSVVRSMVEFQRLTGCRPGEVCGMKIGDIDKSESVWKYVPLAHKTAHHGHHRVILIGPKAQAVLQPFLMKLDPQAHVFSPADSMAEIRQRRSEARVTPLSEGNRPGINRVRNPKRLPRDHYTPDTYNGAISRACELAFQPPPPLCKQERESYRRWMLRLTEDQKAELRKWQKEHHWFANQLRHTAATSLRAKFGLEAAQVILGHRNANITQVYAERDVEAGKRIVAAIG